MDENDILIEVMVQNANNFGIIDLYHPEYGKLIQDGKLTYSGKEFFSRYKEYFEENYEQNGH